MPQHLSFLIILAILFLALACGSGESSLGSSSTSVAVEGTLDFDSASDGLQKARSAAGDTGTVTFTNVDTGATTSVSFTGESYTATLAPGTYSVSAKRDGDNMELKTYLPDVETGADLETEIDLDTTVAALWIDTFDDTNHRAISSMIALARSADTVLGSSSSSNTQRDSAVVINFIKDRVNSRLTNGGTILSNFTVDTSDLATTPSANLFGHLSGNIYLGNGQAYLSSNADLSVVNTTTATNLSFDLPVSVEKMVVFSTDYSSSSISHIDVTSGNVERDTSTYSTSDIGIASYDRHFYVVARLNADFVEKRDIANPGVNLYGVTYPTLDATETSSLNPHNLIFSTRKTAVLTRYGSNVQWLVNPSAHRASDFKKGSIDLGHYDSNDSIPEISSGIYLNGKTWLLAQRLNRNDGWVPSGNAYLIVLDSSGNEIDTGKAAPGSNLLGIELPARNPGKITYSANLGKIVVQCVGGYGSSWSGKPRHFTGGIVTIDPATYVANLLVDDDNGVDEETDITVGGGTYGGLISDVAIISESVGYLTIYSGWGDNSLRSFNPSTGSVGNVVAGFAGTSIPDLEVDRQGRLWLLSGTTVSVLEPATETIVETYSNFTLPPVNITPVRY